MAMMQMDVSRSRWTGPVLKRFAILVLRGRNVLVRSDVIEQGGPTVSMTSFGSRLASVYLALESIAAGTRKPGRLILWTENEDWVRQPPPPIVRLRERGLEIRLTDDFGPHKKYFPYAASEERHRTPLVTADDDWLFPRGWLESLMAAHDADPRTNTAHRVRFITTDASGVRPYDEWPLGAVAGASPRHVAGGGWGHVLTPGSLDALRDAGTRFLGCAPTADDLWIHYVTNRAGVAVKATHRYAARSFRHIPLRGERALSSVNVDQGGNDRQFRAMWDEDFRKLLENDG